MIWFVGDTHFDWENIARHRGFDSAEAHDEFILERINERVMRNDRLIILGDFCSKNPQRWRQRIRCQEVWLVYGNHDRNGWGQCFSQAFQHRTIKLTDGFRVYLSHYPTAYWDGSHKGWGHLYGHTHQAREETLDRAFPGRRSMDVGVDALIHRFIQFRPIGETEISEVLQSRPGHDPVEFYRTNFGAFS